MINAAFRINDAMLASMLGIATDLCGLGWALGRCLGSQVGWYQDEVAATRVKQ